MLKVNSARDPCGAYRIRTVNHSRPIAEKDLSEWFRLRRQLWYATSDDDHKTEMLDIVDHTETQLVVVADADGLACL